MLSEIQTVVTSWLRFEGFLIEPHGIVIIPEDVANEAAQRLQDRVEEVIGALEINLSGMNISGRRTFDELCDIVEEHILFPD